MSLKGSIVLELQNSPAKMPAKMPRGVQMIPLVFHIKGLWQPQGNTYRVVLVMSFAFGLGGFMAA
eukprot:2978226-Amphidinium_carterae.1